jgi:hypothetical protein
MSSSIIIGSNMTINTSIKMWLAIHCTYWCCWCITIIIIDAYYYMRYINWWWRWRCRYFILFDNIIRFDDSDGGYISVSVIVMNGWLYQTTQPTNKDWCSQCKRVGTLTTCVAISSSFLVLSTSAATGVSCVALHFTN